MADIVSGFHFFLSTDRYSSVIKGLNLISANCVTWLHNGGHRFRFPLFFKYWQIQFRH